MQWEKQSPRKQTYTFVSKNKTKKKETGDPNWLNFIQPNLDKKKKKKEKRISRSPITFFEIDAAVSPSTKALNISVYVYIYI